MDKDKAFKKYALDSYVLKMIKQYFRTKVLGHIRKDLASAHLLDITITLFDCFLSGIFFIYLTYPWQNLISPRFCGLGLGWEEMVLRTEGKYSSCCCAARSHPTLWN